MMYAQQCLRSRRSSACPDGGEPLLKPIVARAGDLVEVTVRGIHVNGRLIPNTQARHQDSAGRPLSPWSVGSYRVMPGTVWVASSYHPRSFDSRFFGPVHLSNINNRLRPLWTMQ
jgi:conjugative transfer signal peptidase TraF